MAKNSAASGEHPFVTAYLTRLESELRDAPAQEREDFIARVRAEFEYRLAGIEEPTNKQVLAISARLGQPRALVIEAGLVAPVQAAKPGEPNWFLSRGAVVCAAVALILTFYSSIAAAIVGAVGVILIALCVPRWNYLKKSVVLAAIMLVATGIILLVQALGGAQAVGQ